MIRAVKRGEVEHLLGCRVASAQFNEALAYAKRKQDYIYRLEHRPEALQHWYLVKLTEEYIKGLALSKLTTDLCRMLTNMEKEHQAESRVLHTQPYCNTSSFINQYKNYNMEVKK